MRYPFTHFNEFFSTNRLTTITTLLFLFAFCSFFFMSYKDGPAKNGILATGAPFNGSRTCQQTGCHGGGSFGGSITTELLDENSSPVSCYEPGKSYIFRITLNKTSGTPKYGFQTTAAKASDNTNINEWGTAPTNTHSIRLVARNYVEHSQPLTTNVIDIPWTGPAAETGSVVFYTAGNIVNDNNDVTGDQVVNTSLTIAECTTMPVTLSYFKGTVQNGKAVLNWATTTEINNRNFIIEKSLNGTQFSDLVTIPCKGNSDGSTYSYTDISFSNKAYYRLKQTDFDGSSTVYNTVELSEKGIAKYSLSAYAHAGTTGLLFYNGSQTQKISVRYNDLQGRLLYAGTTTANKGDNLLTIPSGINKSLIIVSVITEDGAKTTTKVGIQR